MGAVYGGRYRLCYKLQHRVECRRTATATGLYDSFCHIFFFLHSFSLHLFVSQKSLNEEERGGNCLLLPERSYGPGFARSYGLLY